MAWVAVRLQPYCSSLAKIEVLCSGAQESTIKLMHENTMQLFRFTRRSAIRQKIESQTSE